MNYCQHQIKDGTLVEYHSEWRELLICTECQKLFSERGNPIAFDHFGPYEIEVIYD